MGIGNSRGYNVYKPRRQTWVPEPRNRTGIRRRSGLFQRARSTSPPKPRNRTGIWGRRGLFQRARSTPPLQPVIPIRQHPSRRYPYGAARHVPPIPYFPQRAPVYPSFIPPSYNNYPYISPQQVQPMQIPQYIQPTLPMIIPQSQPMEIPQQVPSYVPSSYPIGTPPSALYMQQLAQMQSYFNNAGAFAPMSRPYAQVQPQAAPAYNNVGFSAPVPPSYGRTQPPLVFNNIGVSAAAPIGTPIAVTQYPSGPPRVITDWTRGGVISPGFLGPPI